MEEAFATLLKNAENEPNKIGRSGRAHSSSGVNSSMYSWDSNPEMKRDPLSSGREAGS
jgi:hypothetical protein